MINGFQDEYRYGNTGPLIQWIMIYRCSALNALAASSQSNENGLSCSQTVAKK